VRLSVADTSMPPSMVEVQSLLQSVGFSGFIVGPVEG
jgi:hypothetical protein